MFVESLAAMKSIVEPSQCQSPRALIAETGNIVGSHRESNSVEAVTV